MGQMGQGVIPDMGGQEGHFAEGTFDLGYKKASAIWRSGWRKKTSPGEVWCVQEIRPVGHKPWMEEEWQEVRAEVDKGQILCTL